MATMEYTLKNLNSNLFLHTSDTELSKFCAEVFLLGKKYPEIYQRIEADQDTRAKLKKQLRQLDRQYISNQTPDFPGLDYDISNLSPEELDLKTGRPRMMPELVFLFTCLRGYYGSVTDRYICDRLLDSMTLYVVFGNLNLKMPAPTTILENINCLSRDTRDLILKCQLEDIMNSGLDDFTYVLFDSTAVNASSCWPTDAGIAYRLLNRVYVYGKKLEDFGISSIQKFYLLDWLKQLKQLLFKINNTHGTKKCSKKKKIMPLYQDFLKTAHKAYEYLVRIFELRSVDIKDIDLCPSLMLQLKKVHGHMEDDLRTISRVLYYTEDRIFNDVVLLSAEKILSLSDVTAAFINKGQRNPVIGYKPQLAQSGNGFVTGMLLEQGNTSDSASLFPLAHLHADNTGVIPAFISADDGYSSGPGRGECLAFGVKDVCLSGSKGKKITPDELWTSEEYISGRRKRSAIESLMFTLKYVFEFGQLRRRGLENTRAEMTEEIIAYNFRRKILLQEQLQKEKAEGQIKKSA